MIYLTKLLSRGAHSKTPYILSSSDGLRAAIKIILIFFIGCFIGWSHETINDYICGRGFMLRASFLLPFCPIYGIGSVIIALLLYDTHKYKTHGKLTPLFILLAIAFITITVELIGSYICEFLIGYCPWDYSGYFLNFDGRVALNSTLVFLIGGVFIVYLVLNPLSNYVEKHVSSSLLIATILSLLFFYDWLFDSIGIEHNFKVNLVNENPDVVSLQGYSR